MRYLSPWYQSQGGRAVVKTVLPPMIRIALSGSVPRDVGSVLLRYVGFGVTVWNSYFGSFIIFPEGSIRYFWSGIEGFLDGERGVSERSERCCK